MVEKKYKIVIQKLANKFREKLLYFYKFVSFKNIKI